ncbi:hypothetical protein EJ03DRAFT_338830 [Teratosphaeria nubilosa]|uniref:Uncharacterized protein n=1 Tax=Teratosphaeria nubilosa TaxID=161662 RepID=A0A6G1KYR4_9PEZI|nr:hypothetical protein EJ03DRAFT_338830 [Teratosphaeria nubilosa]
MNCRLAPFVTFHEFHEDASFWMVPSPGDAQAAFCRRIRALSHVSQRQNFQIRYASYHATTNKQHIEQHLLIAPTMSFTVREYRELKDIMRFFPTYENRGMTRFWHIWLRRVGQPLKYDNDDTLMYDDQAAGTWKIMQLGKPHESEEAHKDGLEEIEAFFEREKGVDEVKDQAPGRETITEEAVKRGKKKGAKASGEGGEGRVEKRRSKRIECKREADGKLRRWSRLGGDSDQAR